MTFPGTNLGFQGFRGFGPAQQRTDITPYLPGPDEIQAQREENAADSGGSNWFYDFLNGLEGITGAPMVRALLMGDVGEAIKQNPLSHIMQTLLPEAIEPEFLKNKPITFSDVRKAWGQESTEEGGLNFVINMIGDVVSDPGGLLWKPFGLTKSFAAKGGKTSASLAKAVEAGARTLLSFQHPFKASTLFDIPTPKRLNLVLAKNIDRTKNFVASNPISAPIVSLFSKYHSALPDPDQRQAFKEAGYAGEEAGRRYDAFHRQLLNRVVYKNPEIFKNNPDAHKLLVASLEVGMDELDTIADVKYKIAAGIPYAHNRSKVEALLEQTNTSTRSLKAKELRNKIVDNLVDGNLQGLGSAVSEWRKAFPNMGLPDELTKFGKTPSELHDFVKKAKLPDMKQATRAEFQEILRGNGIELLETLDIPAKSRGAFEPLALMGHNPGRVADAQAYATSGAGASETAIRGATEQIHGIFDKLFTEANPEAFTAFKGAARDVRAWLDNIGEADKITGFLNSVSEFYVPRSIIQDERVRKFIDDQSSKFFKGRKITELSLLEADALIREHGSKATGFRPLKLLEVDANDVSTQRAWTKVFDKTFLKQLKKMGDAGADAVQFFNTNPYYYLTERLAYGKRMTAQAAFYDDIFKEGSPFIYTTSTLKEIERNKKYLEEGYRPILVDRAEQTNKVLRWKRDNNMESVNFMLDADRKAQVYLERFDLEEYLHQEIVSGTKTYYQQVQELDFITKFLSNRKVVQGPVTAAQGFQEVSLAKGLQKRPKPIVVDFATKDIDELAAKFGDSHPFVTLNREIEAINEAMGSVRSLRQSYRAKLKETKAAIKTSGLSRSQRKKLHQTVREAVDGLGPKTPQRLTDIEHWNKTKDRLAGLKDRRDKMIEDYVGVQSAYREAADEITDRLTAQAVSSKKSFSKRAAAETLTTKDFQDHFNVYMQSKRNGHLALDQLETEFPDIYAKYMRERPNTEVQWVDQEVYSKLFGEEAALEKLTRPSKFLRSLGWFDNATQIWKGWTTMAPMFLASRTRDVFSGMVMQGVAGMPITQVPKAATGVHQLLKHLRSYMRGDAAFDAKALIFDNGVEKYNFQEMMDQLHFGGVFNNSLFADETALAGAEIINQLPGITDVVKGRAKAWDYFKTVLKPDPTKNAMLGDGRAFAQFGDNYVKGIGTLARWYDGMPLSDAMHQTRLASYDPQNAMLSSFERNVAKRVIPFYTWMKTALNFTFDQMFQRPATVSWMEKAHENAVKASGLKPEEWEAFMPEFVKTSFGIPVSKTKDGSLEVRLFGGFIPMTEVGRLVDAFKETVSNKRPGGSIVEYFGSAMNPILKTVIEQGFNYSFYTGREIEQVPWERTEWMGFTMPKRMKNLLLNLRLLNEIDNLGMFTAGDVEALLKEQKATTDPLEQLLVRSGFSPAGAFKGYKIDVTEQLRRSTGTNELEANRLKSRLRRAVEKKNAGDAASEENVNIIRHELKKRMATDLDIREAALRLGLDQPK